MISRTKEGEYITLKSHSGKFSYFFIPRTILHWERPNVLIRCISWACDIDWLEWKNLYVQEIEKEKKCIRQFYRLPADERGCGNIFFTSLEYLEKNFDEYNNMEETKKAYSLDSTPCTYEDLCEKENHNSAIFIFSHVPVSYHNRLSKEITRRLLSVANLQILNRHAFDGDYSNAFILESKVNSESEFQKSMEKLAIDYGINEFVIRNQAGTYKANYISRTNTFNYSRVENLNWIQSYLTNNGIEIDSIHSISHWERNMGISRFDKELLYHVKIAEVGKMADENGNSLEFNIQDPQEEIEKNLNQIIANWHSRDWKWNMLRHTYPYL